MATANELTSIVYGIINKANETTGESDTNVTDAISSLIAGYGAGGSGGSETYDFILQKLINTPFGYIEKNDSLQYSFVINASKNSEYGYGYGGHYGTLGYSGQSWIVTSISYYSLSASNRTSPSHACFYFMSNRALRDQQSDYLDMIGTNTTKPMIELLMNQGDDSGITSISLVRNDYAVDLDEYKAENEALYGLTCIGTLLGEGFVVDSGGDT